MYLRVSAGLGFQIIFIQGINQRLYACREMGLSLPFGQIVLLLNENISLPISESSPPDCMQEKSFFCRIRWVAVGSNAVSGHLLLVPAFSSYSHFHSSPDAFQ